MSARDPKAVGDQAEAPGAAQALAPSPGAAQALAPISELRATAKPARVASDSSAESRGASRARRPRSSRAATTTPPAATGGRDSGAAPLASEPRAVLAGSVDRMAEDAAENAGAPVANRSALSAARAFEARLALVARGVRLLPAVTARNAAAERVRLQAQLERAEMPKPQFEYAEARSCRENLRFLDTLRDAAQHVPGSVLYLAKLEELELDLALLASLGDPRQVRPLAARRFGRGDQLVTSLEGPVPLIDYARRLLRTRPRTEERLEIPPDTRDGSPCLRSLIEAVARAADLDVHVRVEPNLTAGAATGDRTVFVADRRFGRRESARLAVHEVLGHLMSAANGGAQPLRILEWGTAFAFADQEGVALCLEAEFGLLDRGRLRSLAGRVVATELMHEGASFGDTATTMFREYAFGSAEAIAITERAYRGGGVARDCGYLLGYLRVRAATARGDSSLDELRTGRISLESLPEVRALVAQGLLRPPRYRPNFSRSFLSTSSGTMPWRSPPSAAASLINVELT